MKSLKLLILMLILLPSQSWSRTFEHETCLLAWTEASTVNSSTTGSEMIREILQEKGYRVASYGYFFNYLKPENKDKFWVPGRIYSVVHTNLGSDDCFEVPDSGVFSDTMYCSLTYSVDYIDKDGEIIRLSKFSVNGEGSWNKSGIMKKFYRQIREKVEALPNCQLTNKPLVTE